MINIERYIENLELDIEVEKLLRDYGDKTVLFTASQIQGSLRISAYEFEKLKQGNLFVPIKKGNKVFYNSDDIDKYYSRLERRSLLENMSYDDLYYCYF
jgi:hypothetical protein